MPSTAISCLSARDQIRLNKNQVIDNLQLPASSWRFGEFRLDAARRRLEHNGAQVNITPKQFEVLHLLIRNAPRVVTREEFVAEVWAGRAVEDSNLTQTIFVVRKLLGEQPGGGSWIVTVPGQGYAFAGDLRPETAPVSLPRARLRWWWLAAVACAAIVVILLLRRTGAAPQAPAQAAPITAFAGREMWPAFSPDGAKLYFIWEKKPGESEIHAMELGSGRTAAVTQTGEPKGHLALSPGGLTLAYFADTSDGTEVRAIPAAGGQPRTVAREAAAFPFDRGRMLTWTPDGQSVVFVRVREGARSQLVRVSIPGDSEHPVTDLVSDYPYDTNPAYSPDGKTLAFVRWSGFAIADVWIAPCGPDGSAIAQPRPLTREGKRIQGIAWSADSRAIVVALQKERLPALWRFQLDRAAAEPVPGTGVPAMHPAISPAGERLAYVSETSSQSLWEMDVPVPGRSAPQPRLITESTFVDHGPAYSPDGRWLAFYSTRSGNYEVWRTSLDGKDVRQLTFKKAFAGAPHWSPDGSLLAYDGRDRISDIEIVPAAGGAIRRVAATPEEEAVPSFSRDGQSLYFASNRNGRMQVWKSRLDGSEPRLLSAGEGFNTVEWSDGYVYFARRRIRPEIWRVPAGGGPEQPVLTSEPLPSLWAYWRLAPQGIYFVSRPRASSLGPSEHSLYLLPWGAKAVQWLGTMPDGLPVEPGLAVSPDGKRVAFPRMTQPRSDLMLAEGFR